MDSKTIAETVCRRQGHHITLFTPTTEQVFLCIQCGMRLEEIRSGAIVPPEKQEISASA